MGFYSRVIFPRLIERLMSGEEFHAVRRRLLAEARGETLEIGFGTGLNLEYYTDRVGHLTAIDPNPGMNRRARTRLANAPMPVRVELLSGESLPFDDAAFDCVVSTWTLCSIRDPHRALGEVRRVLRPWGRFLFAEHGRSPDEGVRKWQDRLTPFQKIAGDGCHLNRDIRTLIEGAGFSIVEIDNFYMENMPRVGSYLYVGSATRSLSASEMPSRTTRAISSRSDTDGRPHSSR